VELQNQLAEFRSRGVEVVALAVAPFDAVRNTKMTLGSEFPMLADPSHRVADAYGIYNLLGDTYAAPAVFVIDTDGRILWSYVGQTPYDRPGVAVILENLP
jgi:peroxiredoxin